MLTQNLTPKPSTKPSIRQPTVTKAFLLLVSLFVLKMVVFTIMATVYSPANAANEPTAPPLSPLPSHKPNSNPDPDLTYGIMLRSLHFQENIDPNKPYNNSNLGGYVTHNKLRVSVGLYRNSYNDVSLFAIKSNPVFSKGTAPNKFLESVDYFYGVASGYAQDINNYKGFLPMIGITKKFDCLRLLVTPKTITLSAEF